MPRDLRHGNPKLAEIPNSRTCPVKAWETLLLHRPVNFVDENSPLFLRPMTNEPTATFHAKKQWYYNIRVGVKGVGKLLTNACSLAKIDFAGRKITNSSVRKAVATTLLRNKTPSKAIMRQMGHKNVASLARYDDTDPDEAGEMTKVLFGQQKKEEAGSSTFDLGVDDILSGQQAGPSTSSSTNHRQIKVFNIKF